MNPLCVPNHDPLESILSYPFQSPDEGMLLEDMLLGTHQVDDIVVYE